MGRNLLVKQCLSAVVLAVWSLAACAADWQLVDPDPEASTYVDVASITSSQGVVQAWSKLVLKQPKSSKTGKDYQAVLTLDEYKCHERASRETRTFYFADKEALNQVWEAKRANSTFETVLPESVGEGLLVFACSYAGQSGGGLSGLAQSQTNVSGKFAPWHWAIVLLWLLNVAMIVHIAVAPHSKTATKAIWVVSAIFVPVVPYLVWRLLGRGTVPVAPHRQG